ncbi:MAG: MBL fold metallo-hydrolase [Betaproteobacteria bacterium]|nr:MBL fold metallo-hydrolase [Betaproteobacteria bacterium]
MGVVMNNESVRIPEAERIVISVITDNLADVTRPDCKIARRLRRTESPLDLAAHGEHGLAYHVETVVEGESRCCLFDFGSDARGVLKNMKLLNVDLGKVDALAISHDHWDHQAALLDILKMKRGEWRSGLPLYVGECFFEGTYLKGDDGSVTSLLALNRRELDDLGVVRIVETKGPTAIIPGAFLSGRVEQRAEYEAIPSSFVARRGNEYVPEAFPGEQALFMNARGKGLVVVSACAHRGIINTVRQAQRITGIERVHMVIGGFHLTGASPEIIQRTIADMKAIDPVYVVPTHCTGFEAIAAFAREMPDQFILNTAGTTYVVA